MIHLTINNKAVVVPEGTTILDAAKENGISIPSLCYLKDVHAIGSCRICVVEVQGAKGLMASCVTPVTEGMVVNTNTKRVREARKVLYELILSDHPKDCLSCMRSQSCELQQLGETLQVNDCRFEGQMSKEFVDESSPSIVREGAKCILCRRCVTICNEVQGVGVINAQNRGFATEIAPGDDLLLDSAACTYCGQCTTVCPVNALHEKDSITDVIGALGDPDKVVVVQTAPAIRVAVGEGFGLPVGTIATGKLATALRDLGFDYVFDTNFAADLTIMEEGYELLTRIALAFRDKGVITDKQIEALGLPTKLEHADLPMITSCSPGWIKYIEHYYGDQIDHLSSCKSPHMMLGALAKSFFAEKMGIDPKKMYVVSIMPCTAKKFEVTRPEMVNNDCPNVDAVLTTRELIKLIKQSGIDFAGLPDGEFDNPLGLSSGAADIFGATGGVMEAALRTVYEVVTGREIPFDGLHVAPIVGLERIKTAAITIEDPKKEFKWLNGVTVNVAVTSGLTGAATLLEEIEDGKSDYLFIEVMGCPGGCISGGGQPRMTDDSVREKRLEAIYREDEGKKLRKSHENEYIIKIYDDYLGHPLGHKSHELLHTTYTKRDK
jgi:NADH-quinone oxidoreductase subunit G/NADP-reducing hydrogenase subunit HndD